MRSCPSFLRLLAACESFTFCVFLFSFSASVICPQRAFFGLCFVFCKLFDFSDIFKFNKYEMNWNVSRRVRRFVDTWNDFLTDFFVVQWFLLCCYFSVFINCSECECFRMFLLISGHQTLNNVNINKTLILAVLVSGSGLCLIEFPLRRKSCLFRNALYILNTNVYKYVLNKVTVLQTNNVSWKSCCLLILFILCALIWQCNNCLCVLFISCGGNNVSVFSVSFSGCTVHKRNCNLTINTWEPRCAICCINLQSRLSGFILKWLNQSETQFHTLQLFVAIWGVENHYCWHTHTEICSWKYNTFTMLFTM